MIGTQENKEVREVFDDAAEAKEFHYRRKMREYVEKHGGVMMKASILPGYDENRIDAGKTALEELPEEDQNIITTCQGKLTRSIKGLSSDAALDLLVCLGVFLDKEFTRQELTGEIRKRLDRESASKW